MCKWLLGLGDKPSSIQGDPLLRNTPTRLLNERHMQACVRASATAMSVGRPYRLTAAHLLDARFCCQAPLMLADKGDTAEVLAVANAGAAAVCRASATPPERTRTLS